MQPKQRNAVVILLIWQPGLNARYDLNGSSITSAARVLDRLQFPRIIQLDKDLLDPGNIVLFNVDPEWKIKIKIKKLKILNLY